MTFIKYPQAIKLRAFIYIFLYASEIDEGLFGLIDAGKVFELAQSIDKFEN
ncbi:MAG: hypothetical protein R3B45_01255 [Bdellovibrionota bacterium]